MIRVLQMIGSLERGGSQSMIMNIYRNIDRSNVQFDFIVDKAEHMEYKEEIETLGGIVYVLPAFRGTNVFDVKKAWNQFFIQHTEYKILHSHVRSYASVYIPIAKEYGLTTIIHSHSTSNGKGVQSVIKKIMQYPLRYQADYLFSCSDKAGAWLFGRKALKRKNYRMIPNAIDLQKFAYDESKRNKIRKQLHIEDKFVVGHVGRLVAPKNHQFLLEVFANVLKCKKDSCLILVGDGELRSTLDEKCHQLGIQDAVLFLGSKDNIENYYIGMDVFVFPSLWEGLPITVIEAQATGVTCLISDRITKQVGISELVHYLSIDCGHEIWENAILDTKLNNRKNVVNAIRQAGFDIHDSVSWLEKFYCQL